MDKQIKIYLDKIIEVIKNDYPLFKNMKSYGFKLSEEELNYVLSGLYEQPVTKRGNVIYNQNGNEIYYETSDGQWVKREYDENGNEIYYEDSDGIWVKREYDEKEYIIYYEDSTGNKTLYNRL